MNLKLQVEQLGNGLAVRIPKMVAERFFISEGSSLILKLDSGRVTLQLNEYDLDELVSQITPENRYGEIHADPPQGKEAW